MAAAGVGNSHEIGRIIGQTSEKYLIISHQVSHDTSATLCFDMLDNDVLRLILTQLVGARNIGAVLVSSRRLSLFSHEMRNHAVHFWPLTDIVPLLLELPVQDALHVQQRCHNANQAGSLPRHLFSERLYHTIQCLLQNEVLQGVKWLIIHQWSLELTHVLAESQAVTRWRWRKGQRVFKCRGLDPVAASLHIFRHQGADVSVADFFAVHNLPNMPLPNTRPDLPCMLVGPINEPGRIVVPLEMLELPLPSEEFPFNPRPDQIIQLPPALRSLVEYVRGM